MALIQTRRTFLGGIAAAGTAGLIRTRWAEAAEGPLETTTVRLQKGGLCVSTLYVAEQLLRAEGFTDIGYIEAPINAADVRKVARGEADFGPLYASQCVQAIDAGERMTLLAGVMVGCFELFARELIRRQPILYRGEIGSSGGAARTGMSGPARQASKQVCLDAGQSARVSVQRHQPSH